MSEVHWLIEYRDPRVKQTTGYLRDIVTDGDYAVVLTKDPNKAIKFKDKYSAQSILDDHAFLHAYGEDHPFVICDHQWMDGPPENNIP